MTAIPLSDLREEVADIAKRDGFYVEVAALRARATGLTPTLARPALQPRPAPALAPNRPPAPQTTSPGTPPPRYANPTPTPRTQTQNKPLLGSNPQNSPTNPFQTTPATNRGPFASPATGTNTTPLGMAREPASGPFANWDRRNPYPKTTEGKAAYEAAMHAWWERNGFNGRPTAADLIPLTPGTAQPGTKDCYACGRNDRGDARFPHLSEDCMITPRIPAQERRWRAACGTQARAAAAGDQQDEASIQQVGAYQGQMGTVSSDQGNGEEPTA